MRLFKSGLHQQPVRDALRYFVLLGDLPADRQVGYIAIGAAGGRAPAIGHYCVLTTVYEQDKRPESHTIPSPSRPSMAARSRPGYATWALVFCRLPTSQASCVLRTTTASSSS